MASNSVKGIDLKTLVIQDNTYCIPENISPYNGSYYIKYDNGELAEKGHIKNGKLHGNVFVFNEEGTLLIDAHYSAGIKEGLTTTYYPSGHLKAEFTLVNNRREDRFRMWYDNGGKKYEALYKDDKLNGPQIKYYKNGKVHIKSMYLDNIEEGLREVWNDKGELMFSAIIKGGEVI